MQGVLIYGIRFLDPTDRSVYPQCLQTSAKPGILYSGPSYVNTELDLFDLINDQANDCTGDFSLGTGLTLHIPTDTNLNEENLATKSQSGLVLSTELTGSVIGVDSGQANTGAKLARNTSELQADSRNVDVPAQRQVKRRKSYCSEEHIFSENFSKDQMAQLQNLAANFITDQSANTNTSRSLPFTILEAFAVTVGRSSSIIFLKKLINSYRKSEISLRDTLDSDFLYKSPASRMSMIEALDCQITFQGFLRTCHLYKLTSENKYGLQEIESPFLVNNSLGRPASSAKSRGNPRQQQRAQIYRLMMKDFYPNLAKDHAEYEKKYRKILRLCRTSLRLNQLVSRFGIGLFGLVPLEGLPEDQLIGLLNTL